jgi:hypothetical protein
MGAWPLTDPSWLFSAPAGEASFVQIAEKLQSELGMHRAEPCARLLFTIFEIRGPGNDRSSEQWVSEGLRAFFEARLLVLRLLKALLRHTNEPQGNPRIADCIREHLDNERDDKGVSRRAAMVKSLLAYFGNVSAEPKYGRNKALRTSHATSAFGFSDQVAIAMGGEVIISPPWLFRMENYE